MGRRSQHSIRKRQRELKKREKADAKRIKKAERKGGEELPEDGSEETLAVDGEAGVEGVEGVEGTDLPESTAVEIDPAAPEVVPPAAERIAD